MTPEQKAVKLILDKVLEKYKGERRLLNIDINMLVEILYSCLDTDSQNDYKIVPSDLEYPANQYFKVKDIIVKNSN